MDVTPRTTTKNSDAARMLTPDIAPTVRMNQLVAMPMQSKTTSMRIHGLAARNRSNRPSTLDGAGSGLIRWPGL